MCVCIYIYIYVYMYLASQVEGRRIGRLRAAAGPILQVFAWTTEGYGFLEFEISNSTSSTVSRQPLTSGKCPPSRGASKGSELPLGAGLGAPGCSESLVRVSLSLSLSLSLPLSTPEAEADSCPAARMKREGHEQESSSPSRVQIDCPSTGPHSLAPSALLTPDVPS